MSDTPERREQLERERQAREAAGAVWAGHSDTEVVGYVATRGNQVHFQNVAIAEMQRRLIRAITALNTQSTQQAKQMIRLTWAIVVLTVALGVVAGLQLWAGWPR